MSNHIRCRYTLNVLSELARVQGIPEVTDDQIISWANKRVERSEKGKRMKSFKDSSLKTSLFFLELIAAIEPRAVEWSNVQDTQDCPLTAEKKMLNAKYCISAARKIGACVFLTPEDIVEGNSKMILTFVAGLWMADLIRVM